ncbi:MAG: DHH family phosphoesterase [Oscillospiraceae bacterium]|nr:DHH family phosphoesterase [Oscillospiraceae bacterium]
MKQPKTKKRTSSSALLVALWGLLCVGAYLILSEVLDTGGIGVYVLGAYVAVLLLGLLLSRIAQARRTERHDNTALPPMTNVMLELLVNFSVPLLMCSGDGRIIWKNREWTRTLPDEEIIGKNLAVLCKKELSELTDISLNPDGVDCYFGNRRFSLRPYELSGEENIYYIAACLDKSEEDELSKLLREEDTMIAYIVIDNMEQFSGATYGSYRAAAGEASAILRGWAEEVGGVIEEYERDKYVFFFRAKHLTDFLDNKFPILDRVRELKVGSDELPVTISIGTSKQSGSLADKAAYAASSLDMALQRGGDQAVVKIADGIEIFGGVTRTVQKRTKVRARVMAGELCALISRAKNVLVMGHRNADYDSFGASAGIACLAMHCGAEVKIIINQRDSAISRGLEFARTMPGFENIFVAAETAQDKLSPDTLLIIVDVNNFAEFESPELASNASNVVFIDHHRKTAEHQQTPAITYIEPSASSTCELVSELLEQTLPQGELSKGLAELLFAGIVLDTKRFTYNTGTKTFAASQYLRDEGADPGEVQSRFFSVELEELMRAAHFESNVIIYRGSIAISLNERNDNTNADRVAAAKAADMLLTVDGVDASFAMCRIGENVRISARSKGSMNVQLILEKLSGGGSYTSAATQLDGANMEDTLVRLKAAIDEYLDVDVR